MAATAEAMEMLATARLLQEEAEEGKVKIILLEW